MSHQQAVIHHEKLLQFLDGLISSGKHLYAPQRKTGKTYFLPVSQSGSIVFDEIQTTLSPKEILFPKVERLLSYEQNNGTLHVIDHGTAGQMPDRVLFGSRPCDASALHTLAEFFRRDEPDAFIEQRQKSLTVISVSCVQSDQNCFCTSVGSSPGDTRGSDILLTPVGNGKYFVEVLTEKGQSLVGASGQYFETSGPFDKTKVLANIDRSFSSTEVAACLSKSFDHPFWNDASLRCLGCGACAYVCPVCSCFDIQDEGTAKKGGRLRCWDSCGFSLFTLHTSGHNPRKTQSDRWRQRLMHKFFYMPDRFGLLGCVGCGRCSRACPADMNIKEQLIEIKKTMEI
ncbi:MAG: hydrogenase subunit beta [Ignavibacteriae bacterium]|nr:MAG: hydrogenase subunit beta [Ignavibacteriota bacterium]